MKRVAVVLVLLTATAGRSAPTDPLAGMVPTGIVHCAPIGSNESLQVVDDHTLLLAPVGRKIWKNELHHRCPGLDPSDVLVLEPFGNQLCDGDRFHYLSPPSRVPGPLCRLGAFTVYERARPKS